MPTCITAKFRTGDNSATPGSPWEFYLTGATTPTPPYGQYQWDSSGNPNIMQSPNTDVSLTVPQSGYGNVTWSINGNSIQLTSGTYGNITSVQIDVGVVPGQSGEQTSASLVVTFYDANGASDSHNVSVQAPKGPAAATVTPSGGFTAVRVDVGGTVNLTDSYPLGINDNIGSICVLTDTCNT